MSCKMCQVTLRGFHVASSSPKRFNVTSNVSLMLLQHIILPFYFKPNVVADIMFPFALLFTLHTSFTPNSHLQFILLYTFGHYTFTFIWLGLEGSLSLMGF